MDPKFWLDKWSSNQIGFHENKVHNLLRAIGILLGERRMTKCLCHYVANHLIYYGSERDTTLS